jgi:quercetin dioxygenase-like cupin family protein
VRVTTAAAASGSGSGSASASWQPGVPGRIVGDFRMQLFDIPLTETELTAMTVELADGARAGWHSHPRGQILIAIAGLGLVQAEGGEVLSLRPGDSIWAPPGERHWHGATPGSFLTHLAVSLGPTAWAEEVTEAEYTATPDQ